MKKHRITIVVEFNANPEDYEGLDTDDERLAVDMENFDDDPRPRTPENSYLEMP